MALKYLSDQSNKAESDGLISAREICDEFNTPFDTTAKVMQTMNNHGLLKSVKGIKGGYSLLKPLDQISYMELVMMIEGKDEIGKACVSTKGRCELFEKCNIVTPVEQLNKKLNIYLETLTLAELLNGTSFSKENSNTNLTNQALLT